MGCCLSAGKAKAPLVPAATQIPPPPVEEESVKEVVVQSVSVAVPDPDPDPVPSTPQVSDLQPELRVSVPSPEISQSKSDICSVTHSFSTATTATAASILEDDALSKPHRPPPPPSSHRNRPERISRSPTQGRLRPRLVRERPSPQPNLRNVDSGPLPRSGLLEGPRRRSRSPATRVPSSARRSPMKKREPDAEVKKEVNVQVKKEDVAVKDPEVSMECFIFL